MKPELSDLIEVSKKIEPKIAAELLRRLDDDYFQRFDLRHIATHLEVISRLSPKKSFEVLMGSESDDTFTVTIISHDRPAIFSLITGILAAMNFSIDSGEIFTYRREDDVKASRRGRHIASRLRKNLNFSSDRRIIDHFSGVLKTSIQEDLWLSDFKKRLGEVITLLDSKEKDASRLAKRKVNEMVTQYLRDSDPSDLAALYPVEIDIDDENENFTRLKVVSQDTPAFLYTMSASLSLQKLSIDHVRIRTALGRIEDSFDLTTENGKAIKDRKSLDKLKLSVLLTKQFTYFLDQAPDPYAALSRFEQLVTDIISMPDSDRWISRLSDPHAMDDLAKVLGASDFLWEDFIRMQYEILSPIFKAEPHEDKLFEDSESVRSRLDRELETADDFDEKKHLLNKFKNRELFSYDLDNILDQNQDFQILASNLTRLAEAIVGTASELVYTKLVEKHGVPRTVAGLETKFAILGLGKLGGGELGYASDIELILVYADNGETDGASPISNLNFFSTLVKDLNNVIISKKEGIFQLDLRLRPYGEDGPLGVSLENFCRYYGSEGAAHSYEKLALVRMRAIAGDRGLGEQLERLRDEFIYGAASVNLEALSELRKKQFEEKKRVDKYNAKFSPGALVDLEYTIQTLQVIYGGEIPELMTPGIQPALKALKNSGTIKRLDFENMIEAYAFFRRLINGLRMLRGSAKDLWLPAEDTLEFTHLARRMGYKRQGDLSAQRQLLVEFKTLAATVRVFVEKYLGEKSLPDATAKNIVDLIISDTVPREIRNGILKKIGFSDGDRAYHNLKSLAGTGRRRDFFMNLAVLAVDILRNEPDPDMALNNLERFIGPLLVPEYHYQLLFSQPKRFEILLGIFANSQFLADSLINNPDWFDWITSKDTLYRNRGIDELEEELRFRLRNTHSDSDWLDAMRLFRKREILRIGTRDMCLKVPFEDVTSDLSNLAVATIRIALEKIWLSVEREYETNFQAHDYAASFCVLAFGKLGGNELNYSSDLDLIGVYDESSFSETSSDAREKQIFHLVMEKLLSDLSSHTKKGYVYRVDLRLRPYGKSGTLVSSTKSLLDYYQKSSSFWETQALLKASPIAGNLPLGSKLLKQLSRHLTCPMKSEDIFKSISELRQMAVKKQSLKRLASTDIKSGAGGIRDIEFSIQGLQLSHANEHPGVLEASSMQALKKLTTAGVLDPTIARQFGEDYVFLRTIEHYLQILDDQQTHSLPNVPRELENLAKRILGAKSTGLELKEKVEVCRERIGQLFEKIKV